MYLSKSKYVSFCRCPKLAWISKHKPNEIVFSDNVKSRFEDGHLVGEVAKGYFGQFTDVTVFGQNGKPDLLQMIDKTKKCIANGVENIAEASFSYDGLYCAVDILHKEEDGYSIYEVKSTSDPKRVGDYADDVSYQRYVVSKCGVKVVKTVLMYLNKNYVRHGDLDVHQLFSTYEFTEQAKKDEAEVEAKLAEAESVLNSNIEPTVQLCKECCGSPRDCEAWAYCTKHLPQPSVFDVYNMGNKVNKYLYYEKGLVSYSDLLATGDFTGIQKMQMEHQLNDCSPHIDKQGIRDFLSTLSYPLYFLDFETMQSVIPEFDDSYTNQQIPFQYSLHYIEHKGAEVLHKEFLAVSGEDPRRKIAESLVANIPDDACVLAYNKSFECGKLKDLAELFPDLSEHLLSIASNVKDLIEPFRAGHYYNRLMGGSFSIKSVLPALFPNRPELDYHNLNGVRKGDEASALFPRIKDLPLAEQAKARESLLIYCNLDTFAMVVIWQELLIASV